MRSRIFEPRMSPDETTGGRNTKFGMIAPEVILSGATEGFFEFSPRTRDMGPPPGGQEGWKKVKNFFLKIEFFLMDFDRFVSVVSYECIISS